MMPRRLGIVRGVCAFAVGASTTTRVAAGQGPVTISNGIEQMARRDVPAAMRFFRLAAADPNPALRSAAEQWLGHLSWMVYADARSASMHLDRASIDARDSSTILVERARLLAFERRYRDATRVAVNAMRMGIDGEHRGLAARTAIDVAVDGAFAAITSNTSIMDSVDAPAVAEALDSLSQRVKRFPGRTADAMAMLSAGVLRQDRQAVSQAVDSYFALINGPPPATLDSVRRLLLPRPPANPTSNRTVEGPGAELLRMANALAVSRLYEPAALLLESYRQQSGSRLVSPLDAAAAYGVFLHQLRAATNDYYRRALLGLARAGDLDRTITAHTRSLWSRLSWPTTAPPYYPAAVPRELKKRFNTVISVERGGRVDELHLAHAIETLVVAAPIASGQISQHTVVLDATVSNGLDYWLLDGAAGRAGWVSGDSIFELRPAFTEAPFRSWMSLTDPQTVPGELVRILRDSVADVVRARRDSAAYLPGVAARLFRAGASAILDSISSLSMPYAAEEAAFVGVVFQDLTRSTIVLHEARHLADAQRPDRAGSGAAAEFRAKIDEVSAAPHPKLALTAILHPNIGDPSPHGQANRRVMLGLIRWIRAHEPDIVGFDSLAPVLVQLPLLTDGQLRAAFLSMRTGA